MVSLKKYRMANLRKFTMTQKQICMIGHNNNSIFRCLSSQLFNLELNIILWSCSSSHKIINTILSIKTMLFNLMSSHMTSLQSKMRNGNGCTILKMFAYLVLLFIVRKLQMMKRIMVKSLISVAQSMNTMMNKMLLILSSTGHRCNLLPADM